MKKTVGLLLTLALLILAACAMADVAVDSTNFPDPRLLSVAEEKDTNGDGQLSAAEISAVYRLNVSADNTKGIEYFTALEDLTLWGSYTALDISKNTQLLCLEASSSQLAKLDLTHNPYLTEVYWEGKHSNNESTDEISLYGTGPHGQSLRLRCSKTVSIVPGARTSVPVDAAHFPDSAFRAVVSEKFDRDGNGRLDMYERNHTTDGYDTSLHCEEKGIVSIAGIEYLESIYDLTVWDNKITSLDLRNNKRLKIVRLNWNPLTSLQIAGNTTLEVVAASECSLTSLDASGCTSLEFLGLGANSLKSLNISGCKKLQSLALDGNSLKSLNVSGCPDLCDLSVMDNPMTSLDLSGNSRLQTVLKKGTRTEGYYKDFSRPAWLYEYTPGNTTFPEISTWRLDFNQDMKILPEGLVPDAPADPTNPDTPADPTDTDTPVPTGPEQATVSGGVYKLNHGKRTAAFVRPENKNAKTLKIPEKVNVNGTDYKVTEIRAKACSGMKKLTTVTVGKNVTKIGKQAFAKCKKLKKITIKNAKMKKASFGSKCFSGIAAKAKFKVPKAALKNYTDWIISRGKAPKTVSVKK